MTAENFNGLLQLFGCLMRLKWAVTKDHQNLPTGRQVTGR